MTTKIYSFYIILFFAGLMTKAQTSGVLLTKAEAVQNLFENNYQVKLATLDQQIAENNTSIYNSGYLPTLSLQAGSALDVDHIYRENTDNTTFSQGGLDAQSYNAALQLSYTIFDGFNRKYLNQQLQEQLAISELEAQAITEEALLDLLTIYYQVAAQTENVNLLKEALEISQKRLERAGYQYEYGQTNKLSVLNAQVDVEQDSINVLNAQQLLGNLKRNLNFIMGTGQSEDYVVETAVDFMTLPVLEELIEQLDNHPQIQQLQKAMRVAELSLKRTKSNLLPDLNANTSYTWSHLNNNDLSPYIYNGQNGWGAGLSLNWPIFDGGRTKTNIQNAKLTLESQHITEQQFRHQLENVLRNTYADHQNKLAVFEAQKRSVATAQINFERTEEQFKLGRVTSVEYRQAQLNLLQTQQALSSAKYNAKIAELQLWQLVGVLMEKV